MKNALTYILEWKNVASLTFVGALLIYMVISMCLGATSVKFTVILALLLISMTSSLLQMIAFTDLIFKRLRYSLRLIIFATCFFVALGAMLVALDVFPAGQIGAWITFTAIFIIIFALITLGYEIYFRAAGRKYNHFLGNYKEKQNEQE